MGRFKSLDSGEDEAFPIQRMIGAIFHEVQISIRHAAVHVKGLRRVAVLFDVDIPETKSEKRAV